MTARGRNSQHLSSDPLSSGTSNNPATSSACPRSDSCSAASSRALSCVPLPLDFRSLPDLPGFLEDFNTLLSCRGWPKGTGLHELTREGNFSGEPLCKSKGSIFCLFCFGVVGHSGSCACRDSGTSSGSDAGCSASISGSDAVCSAGSSLGGGTSSSTLNQRKSCCQSGSSECCSHSVASSSGTDCFKHFNCLLTRRWTKNEPMPDSGRKSFSINTPKNHGEKTPTWTHDTGHQSNKITKW